ncbi:TIGR01906 family membrane protein [Clostridium sp. UBA1056]|uniref:TIGR01906 family membrane protein n=1 Tax=unclassified Clostridium TaxID=2614128 RepID=UPI003217E22C
MKKFILNASITIVGFILILLISTVITTSIKSIYTFSINKFNIEESTNLSVDEMKENYSYVIDYLLYSNNDKFELPSLEYSEDGAFHFQEVKELFKLAKVTILILAIILIILCVVYTRFYKNYKYIKYISITSIIVPTITSIVVSINFNFFFTVFHKIFFNNDKWLFNPNVDPIINILPKELFALCAGTIVIICVFIGVILYTAYNHYNKRKGFRKIYY